MIRGQAHSALDQRHILPYTSARQQQESGKGGRVNEDVEEAIIQPMQALYPPPVHLRNGDGAMEMALDTSRKGLARFQRPVLEAAWQKVAEANAYWTWPKLADLVNACEQFAQAARMPKRDGPSHDERIEKASSLAYAYTKRFMQTSQLACRAREEGWEAPLKQYVDAAAWVQGQMIAGCQHLGYSAHALFDYTRVSRDELDERREEFFEKAREQAAKGHIRVSVPPHMVERWKRAPEREEARAR